MRGLQIERFFSLILFCGLMALAIIVANAAHADETQTGGSSETTIQKQGKTFRAVERGHFKIAGGADFSGNRDVKSVRVFPEVDFFALDRLSIGLAVGYGGFYDNGDLRSFRNTDRSVSPRIGYYFYTSDDIAFSVHQEFMFRSVSNDGQEYWSRPLVSSLALDWFINPSVALTPSIGFEYGDGASTMFTSRLQLSVYL